MPKIPDSEIERIKSDLDLAALIAASGVQLKKKGSNWIGLCPFHNDQDPSLVVTPSKNLWNCLGACQSGGDAFSWVMKRNRVDFRKAYEVLRESLEGPGPKKKEALSRAMEKPSCVVDESTRQEFLEKVMACYQTTLKESSEAQAYLEKRGILNAEAIETFRIGYSDRSLSKILPNRQNQEGAKVRS